MVYLLHWRAQCKGAWAASAQPLEVMAPEEAATGEGLEEH